MGNWKRFLVTLSLFAPWARARVVLLTAIINDALDMWRGKKVNDKSDCVTARLFVVYKIIVVAGESSL